MSLVNTVKELRQKRAKCVADAGAILEKAGAEGRAMTAEEREQWDKFHEESETLRGRIEPMEQQLNAESDLGELVNERGIGREDVAPAFSEARERTNPETARAQRNRVLRSWLLGNPLQDKRDVAVAQRSGMQFGAIPTMQFRLMDGATRPKSLGEARALTSGAETRADGDFGVAANIGGETVPSGFVARIEESMLAFGGMRRVSTILRTASGNELPFPTANDTAQTGELLAEHTEAALKEIATSEVVFNAFKYSSKVIKLSLELLQDTGVDIESFVAGALGTRIGRITNTHFTTGDGSSKPRGVVTAAGVGKTAAATGAVTYLELLDLKHSVDPAYRELTCHWMLNDATLKAIKQLLDGDNRPLWQAGIAAGAPDTIDGDPWIVNQQMASMAANAKPIAYGGFEKYIIRDVMDVTLFVLRERFITAGQVGMLAFSRHDGDLLDAGTDPIKVLQNAAA